MKIIRQEIAYTYSDGEVRFVLIVKTPLGYFRASRIDKVKKAYKKVWSDVRFQYDWKKRHNERIYS